MLILIKNQAIWLIKKTAFAYISKHDGNSC